MTLIPDLRGRLAESSHLVCPHVRPRRSIILSLPGAFCVGNADFHSSCRATEERFVWEMPIYKPHVESRRSVLRGKFLFTNLRSSHGGAFCVGNAYLQTQLAAWRSASCGKFLFTNSTGAFRVGNFYLQTQLVCFPCLQTIYKKPHSSGKKHFPGERSVVRNPSIKLWIFICPCLK